MMSHRKILRLAWDVWRTGRGETSAIVPRQKKRLADLIEFARIHSPFYRKLYRHITFPINDLRHLPPVTKHELMANFDDWVTDRAVTKAGVENFIADKTLIGGLYLGRYAVWTSSGVTGRAGIFVHDGDALTVYATLAMARGIRAWMTSRNLLTFLLRGGRGATVIATGGHFAGAAVNELYPRICPRLFKSSRAFSVLTPLGELMKDLNALQPAFLVSYPTVLALLADAQRDGTLRIKPLFVATSGEWLGAMVRDQIAAAFTCSVRDAYASSEFMGIAFDCKKGQLHLNSDWLILELVDAHYQPVPPGQASRTVLLTNLANRAQPIIRYDLGDSITLIPGPCPCGSSLPVIRVEGRRDEIISCQGPGGEVIRLAPMALANVVEETPGVRCYQVIQTGQEVLTVRLESAPGYDSSKVWEEVTSRLNEHLSVQGLPSIRVERSQEPPMRDPVSGKFRNVWAELKTGKE